jgi:hypothetical protein
MELHISTCELGDVDLGPRRVLAGVVSSDRALNHVSESDLGLFDKHRELEIMLFNCMGRWLILKEEPPSL